VNKYTKSSMVVSYIKVGLQLFCNTADCSEWL